MSSVADRRDCRPSGYELGIARGMLLISNVTDSDSCPLASLLSDPLTIVFWIDLLFSLTHGQTVHVLALHHLLVPSKGLHMSPSLLSHTHLKWVLCLRTGLQNVKGFNGAMKRLSQPFGQLHTLLWFHRARSLSQV